MVMVIEARPRRAWTVLRSIPFITKWDAKVFRGSRLSGATFHGSNPSEVEGQDWDAAVGLGERARREIRRHELDYYVSRLEQVRAKTLAELGRRNDRWLEDWTSTRSGQRVNNYFKCFQVIGHEINHRGSSTPSKLWTRNSFRTRWPPHSYRTNWTRTSGSGRQVSPISDDISSVTDGSESHIADGRSVPTFLESHYGFSARRRARLRCTPLW
jgi:hypothetical protein